MKILPNILLLLFILLTAACQKEDSCDTNATLNGDCFNLVLELEVQSNVGQTQHRRERMSFTYQYAPAGPQERVSFTINADDAPQNNVADGAFVQFETGVTYTDSNSSFVFNGNQSAGGIPASYSVMFTRIDRENNLASGEISFEYSNDFGSDEFESDFNDVEVSGEL